MPTTATDALSALTISSTTAKTNNLPGTTKPTTHPLHIRSDSIESTASTASLAAPPSSPANGYDMVQRDMAFFLARLEARGSRA